MALCRGMYMLELLKFAMPLLELQLAIGHGSLFGLQGRLELSNLVVTRCHGSTCFSHCRLTFRYARLQKMHVRRAGLQLVISLLQRCMRLIESLLRMFHLYTRLLARQFRGAQRTLPLLEFFRSLDKLGFHRLARRTHLADLGFLVGVKLRDIALNRGGACRGLFETCLRRLHRRPPLVQRRATRVNFRLEHGGTAALDLLLHKTRLMRLEFHVRYELLVCCMLCLQCVPFCMRCFVRSTRLMPLGGFARHILHA